MASGSDDSTPAQPDDRRHWALFLGGLSLLALLTMLHLLLVYRAKGMPLSVREAFLSGLATWYPWVLLSPAIFAISRRYPFDPQSWRRSLAVHLPAGFAIGALYCVVRWLLSYIPWVDEQPIPFFELLLTQFYLTFLSYVAIVSAYQAWLNYRRFQERQLRASQLEAQLARAELDALRMQLQPHFLFNTLHAISTLVHRDPDAADDMITQLSDLLRMTLDNIGTQEVTLKEELDFLQRYLDIQQTRFQDRLKINLDVPPVALDRKVPNQILQPIVENAIRHGLDARPGSGLLEIRVEERGDLLAIAVRDDGQGIGPQGLREGVGLRNTRARMRELYGQRGEVSLRNHPEGGLIVTLTVPQAATVAVA